MRKRFQTVPPSVLMLAAGAMINMMGFSFVWPLTMIYITRGWHESATTAGWVMMLEAGAGALGSMSGGLIYDKIGGKWTIAAGALLAAATAFVLASSPGWAVFVLALSLLHLFLGMILPGIMAMAGAMWPDGGRRPFNLIYLAQNVGVAAGTALGGMLAAVSFSYSFLANGATFFLFALLLLVALPRVKAAETNTASMKRDSPPTVNEKPGNVPALLLLCAGMMCSIIPYTQWQVSIPAQMLRQGYSLSAYSVLWTLNGLLILLLQPVGSRMINRYLPDVSSQLRTGAAIYAGSFLLLLFYAQYAGFVAAMILLTVGEVLVWPGIPAAAQSVSPEGRRGLYQGLVTASNYMGRMISPLIGGMLSDRFSPFQMMLAFLFFCLAAWGCFSLFAIVRKRTRGSWRTAHTVSWE
jgi:MFS family permease